MVSEEWVLILHNKRMKNRCDIWQRFFRILKDTESTLKMILAKEILTVHRLFALKQEVLFFMSGRSFMICGCSHG